MFLALPGMGLLWVLPEAMQTHTGESALMAGEHGSETISRTHIPQPGWGVQPLLLQPLHPSALVPFPYIVP